MAKYYWVGGSGDWYDGSHWSLTSGGTGNAIGAGQGPTYADDVEFNSASNASSYSVTITGAGGVGFDVIINAPASGTVSITLNNGQDLTVYSSLTVAATGVQITPQSNGITLTSTKNVFSPIRSSSYSLLINTNNSSALSTTPIKLDAGSSTYSFQLQSSLTCGALTFVSGGIITSGYNITASSMSADSSFASGANTVSLGSSTFDVSGTCNLVNFRGGGMGMQYAETPTETPFSVSGETWNAIEIASGMGYTLLTLKTSTQSQYNTFVNRFTGWSGIDWAMGISNFSANKVINTGLSPQQATYWSGLTFSNLVWNGNQLTGTYANASNWTWVNNIKAGDTVSVNGSGSYTVTSNTSDATTIRINLNSGGSDPSISYITVTTTYGQYVNLASTYVNSMQALGFNLGLYSIQLTIQYPSLSNTTSGQPTLSYAGGGMWNIVLSGASQQYTGPLDGGYGPYGGSPIYIPKITIKTPVQSTNPHHSITGSVKSWFGASKIGRLVIESPTYDGYYSISAPDTNIIVRYSISSNTTGNNPLRRILFKGASVQSNALGYYPNKCSIAAEDGYTPTVNILDTDFTNMTINGTWVQSAGRVGDAGGNDIVGGNFAFNTPRTLYWSGAAGGTVNGNTTNWSTTDGGAPTAGITPLPQDTIKFTNNTLNSGATLTMGSDTIALPNIDFSLRTNPVTLNMGSNDVYAYGNITLSSAVTMTASAGLLYFAGVNQSIVSNGVSFTKAIVVFTYGNLTFTDNFTSVVSYYGVNTPSISHIKGQIVLPNNVTVTTRDFGGGGYPAVISTQQKRRTINSGTGSSFVLTGINGAYVWNNLNCNDFVTDGITPQVYVTTFSYTGDTRYVVNTGTQPEWVYPIDLYINAGNTVTRISGTFGTIDNSSSTATGSYKSVTPISTILVRGSIKLLEGSTIAGGYNVYLHPQSTSGTLPVVTNWVAGQGAVGANGSTIDYMIVGYAARYNVDGSAGTVVFSSPCSITNLDVQAANVTFSNTTINVGNFQTSFGYSATRTITFTNTTMIASGTSPAFFQGSNITFVNDSTSKIQITGTGSTINIGNIISGTSTPHIEIKTTSLVLSSAGSYDKLTLSGGQTLKITAGYTVTVKNFATSGSLASPIIIQGQSGTGTIRKDGGYLDLTGVQVSNVTFTGSASKRAWQSTSGTGVSGITVKPSKKPLESSYLVFC